MMKLHKQDYKYKWENKTMSDVSMERVQNITEKFLSVNKPVFALVKDNGRTILAFRTQGYYEEYMAYMEQENSHGDVWYQCGEEKVFSFSDEYDNYNIVVAEFWTEAKFDHEEQKDIDAYTRHYYGIKEDDGRYSVWDVYSERELL
jgi:hypothetical protein